MTQCVTSLNFNFLAKFTVGNCKVGVSQTPSPGSPNLESSARTKIHSHIQRYFIWANKQGEETTEETEWILVLKPSKLRLLQTEAYFSLLQRICRISSGTVNKKNEVKHPSVGPLTWLQESNPVEGQNASLRSMLLVFSPPHRLCSSKMIEVLRVPWISN